MCSRDKNVCCGSKQCSTTCFGLILPGARPPALSSECEVVLTQLGLLGCHGEKHQMAWQHGSGMAAADANPAKVWPRQRR
jgi:hypothetical protein